jgi:hypothetical protein
MGRDNAISSSDFSPSDMSLSASAGLVPWSMCARAGKAAKGVERRSIVVMLSSRIAVLGTTAESAEPANVRARLKVRLVELYCC